MCNQIMKKEVQEAIRAGEQVLQSKRKIASTLTFLGGCFAATDI